MCGQCGPMPYGTLIFIAAVFTLAGFAKGVIGLGLPAISMGLLAVVMPPIEAAAILILRSGLRKKTSFKPLGYPSPSRRSRWGSTWRLRVGSTFPWFGRHSPH
jgi:hypothetical protein